MRVEHIIKFLDDMALIADEERKRKNATGESATGIVLRETIALLRTHPDNQPNEPLTLEELREMDGQPGWCKECKHWGLISVCSSGRRAHIPYFQFCKTGITWAHNTQKLNLTIYRRPPKEEKS